MNNSPIYKRISEALLKKKHAHLFRQCAQPENSCIDLSTNSYLSLQTNSKVIEAARKLAGENLHGNLASRVVSSGSPLFTELENEIASWKHAESTLVFNTGYAANVGMLQAIASRSTTIFCDKLNHASIIDGILLSGAKLVRYRHGDMDDLKTKLAVSVCKEKLIVTDSIFSMDGDCAPLFGICELARKHDCMVMVDEAHATGVFGATGSGLVEELGLESSIDIRMGTLSKSIAGMGGYFAGPSLLRDYFVNSSRSFIYSTALPHSVLAWDLAALRYVKATKGMGPKLLMQARRFKEDLSNLGFDTLASTTHIIPCVLGKESSALSLSGFLRKAGILAPAIRPPTVPATTARLRFSLHCGISDSQLGEVVAAIKDWKTGNGN
jgi:8-amino-7-oxononanoate synthase